MEYRIVICDDSQADRDYAVGMTHSWTESRSHDLQIVCFSSGENFLFRQEDEGDFDILLQDIEMGGINGVTLAKKLLRNEKVLVLESNGSFVRIPIYSVRYADVQGNYVTVHADRDYSAKMPLRDLAQMLDRRFYRIGRSAIVNLAKISRVTRGDIYLQDGTVIPLLRDA